MSSNDTRRQLEDAIEAGEPLDLIMDLIDTHEEAAWKDGYESKELDELWRLDDGR